MMLAWVPSLTLLLFLPSIFGHVAFHDWQCGSEDTSRRYAYDTVYEKCPDVASELNHCCVVHDECYVRQLGQDKCDSDFCKCNEKIMNRTEESQECRFFTNTVCALMPFMGIFAYENSVNYTEPANLPKYLPRHQTLQDPFLEMYTACPNVNSTTSSCAIMWNNCLGNDYFCGTQLCECVQNAYKLDHNAQCGLAVSHICAVAENGSGFNRFFSSISNPILFIISALLFVSLISLAFFFYRRERDEATLIKYTNVIDV